MKNRIISGITPSKSLNWIYRKTDDDPVYPPAVTEIDGEFFQLNTFDIYFKDYFLCETQSLAEALNRSVSLYGISTLNTVELANLTVICDRLKIDKKKIEAFSFHNIKGDKNFETLKSVTHFCPVLMRYLSVKPIPVKTIAVFDKLEKEFRRFVKNTVDDKDISVQEFRKMVNLLFDMQASTKDEEIGPDLLKKLTAKKDMTRLSFMKQMQNLTAGMKADIFSDNSFETAELTVSFKINSPDELKQKVKYLGDDIEKIENIYRFLDEQNIY
ncbi:MAG: hypothetical protein C0602_12875 [Denitrovibrio sp.]|nr:MAG: hypothetical protein C0602_12875 [Denitrovibrio sp.]